MIDYFGTNVGEIKNLLADVPDDYLVIMSADAEGNSFSPLSGTSTPGHYRYRAESTWSGEIVDPDEKNDADGMFYYDEGDRAYIEQLPKCVVLWPVN